MAIGNTKCNYDGCSNEATKEFKTHLAMTEYPKYCSIHITDKWTDFQKDYPVLASDTVVRDYTP